MARTTIGIVGLGMIGGGMAMSAVRAGHRVIGYDIAAAACDRARANGVEVAGSRSHLIAEADIIATSLSSKDAILATYLDDDGIAALATPGTVTIETSTVPPELATRVNTAATERGLRHVEASVIGVGEDADAGELYFYLAGDPAAVDAAEPFFAATGRGRAHLGRSGAAAIAKVLNNAIGYTTIVAIGEALAIARRHDIDVDQFVRVVLEGRGSGDSVVFRRHAGKMANYQRDTDTPSPVGLKDAAAMAALIETTPGGYPTIRSAVDTYLAALPDAHQSVQATIAGYTDRAPSPPTSPRKT